VTSSGPAWGIAYLVEALNSWAQRENPSKELRKIVARWAFNQHEDPYQGVSRQPGFPNLWFGEVPGTRAEGAAVTCTYWIEVATHTVKWDNFTTLNLPL
jgi:hypothetical protein